MQRGKNQTTHLFLANFNKNQVNKLKWLDK